MIHFASNNGVIMVSEPARVIKRDIFPSDYYMSMKMCFLPEMKGYYTDMGGAICVLEARRVITGKRKFPQTYMLQIRKENSARQF